MWNAVLSAVVAHPWRLDNVEVRQTASASVLSVSMQQKKRAVDPTLLCELCTALPGQKSKMNSTHWRLSVEPCVASSMTVHLRRFLVAAFVTAATECGYVG
jgi:hypothetical protein